MGFLASSRTNGARAGTWEWDTPNLHTVAEARTGAGSVKENRAVMQIADLLVPDSVFVAVKAHSKKQLFQDLSAKATRIVNLSERRVYEIVNGRERLGTTGVGQGIAIPHGRDDAIGHIVGMFARLDTPVEYDAVDNQPVDLVFLLLAPESAGADHLKALARVSRLLRNQAVCSKLRAAASSEELYAILTAPPQAKSAAA